ncbi:DUF732 domain-containing protein [Mycolicibacterium bacteremicum]|uniref:DUF732 domain-containing protein n=1 Tax=Mycolicibacterium bacteremicum TaxID=564198 RepID=UPI0026F20DDC|nr:DUF732 domain-containing protein [Mycolicibacterium bacteremicum]
MPSSLLRPVLASCVVGAAALLGAPAAAADERTETAYLNALRTAGIVPGFYTPGAAIASAQKLCATMDGGVDQLDVVDVVIDGDRVPEDVATFVVGTATIAFCPWNSMNG